MNMNPQQLKKGASEALVLLQAMQDPKSWLKQVKELDDKLKSLDEKSEQIRGLAGIVDTLADAERIRADANAHKEHIESECAVLRGEAKAEFEDSQHRIDDLLKEATGNRDETHRLLDEAVIAHDEREETIQAGEKTNYTRSESLNQRENTLLAREEALEAKVKKAGELFS